MKILYVEPFYSGAHKQWIDSYQKKSKHKIKILSHSGSHWKWRMHGAAISLSKEFLNLKDSFDLIIVSDMLNLPLFKVLCQSKIKKTKIIIYFHENQISYPLSDNNLDKKLNRDLHYAFINYSSSFVSNWNLFNSQYHLDSYIDGLEKYLKKMPDFKNLETIDKIKNKSSVLHIGCDLNNMKTKIKKTNNTPIILWNHRWEYDKNPEDFFHVLYKIKDKGLKFKVVVLGKKYSEYPSIFDEAKIKLSSEILYFGFCESHKEYVSWLNKADIIPVTSNQDFFGISIVEAIHMNNFPILPNRLSYRELLDDTKNPQIFYRTNSGYHTNDCTPERRYTY